MEIRFKKKTEIFDVVITALDFMVEKMETSPLSEYQRSELAGLCQEIMEEPTARGFRVRLII